VKCVLRSTCLDYTLFLTSVLLLLYMYILRVKFLGEEEPLNLNLAIQSFFNLVL